MCGLVTYIEIAFSLMKFLDIMVTLYKIILQHRPKIIL